MFSGASRDLLTSVVVAVVAASSLDDGSQAPALVIGLAAGLFGPRALEPLKERAAGVLGVKSTNDGRQQLSLSIINGLTEDVASRLAEEGIDSVHALAFTTTPRIFFSTPYSWERIADWQAQALLLEELGLARFARFKEQFPVRNVQEALKMLQDPATRSEIEKDQFPHLEVVAKALQSSPTLNMLALYATYGDVLLGGLRASGDLDRMAPPSWSNVLRKPEGLHIRSAA
jgi:hypothetical protein